MSSNPEKPGRGRPKTLKKAAVIDAAMQAYWQEGPTNVSLNEVCARAGVSKPSVYREFGNDDGLAAAVLEVYAETVLGQMLGIVQSDEDLATKLSKIVSLAAADPLHDHGCLFVKMRAARDQLGPKTQAVIGQIDGMALEAFTKLFAQARTEGGWTSSLPADLAAAYTHAQIGLALDYRARGEDPRAILDLALSVLQPAKL